MPVFLLSDVLWWLVVIVLLGLARQAKNNLQTKQKWIAVFSRPSATISATIFFFYVLITCLDSVHFKSNDSDKYRTSIISVVDVVISGLSNNKELTYSAPFSGQLHSKMTVESNGVAERKHLPLNKVDKQTPSLVLLHIFKGLLVGLLITFMVLFPFHLLTRKWHWKTRKLAYFCLAFLICINAILLSISPIFHVFGTNKIGDDVFYEAIKGIRTAMLLGTLTTLILLPLALISGISAGFYRGLVDDVIQYVYTTLNSVPGVLLIASSLLVFQGIIDANADLFSQAIVRSDTRLIILCLVLGLTSWTGLCRLLRAETLKIRSLEYIDASRAFGISSWTILSKHILPNLTHIVLIVVVLDFSGLVLAEAVLSYIGIGVDPSMPSWGNMINNARFEISKEPVIWWPITAIFSLMFVLVLSVNLFADKVRQVFDPRQ